MEYKICRGPYHREGKKLPTTAFAPRRYRTGKVGLSSWCLACIHHKKHKNKQPNHGYVPLDRVWWIFDELIRRLGHMEAARRIGMDHTKLRSIKIRARRQVQKQTVARAILALRKARETNEFRHRDSICHGALQRGRQEKQVSEEEDRYDPAVAEKISERWRRANLNRGRAS